MQNSSQLTIEGNLECPIRSSHKLRQSQVETTVSAERVQLAGLRGVQLVAVGIRSCNCEQTVAIQSNRRTFMRLVSDRSTEPTDDIANSLNSDS